MSGRANIHPLLAGIPQAHGFLRAAEAAAGDQNYALVAHYLDEAADFLKKARMALGKIKPSDDWGGVHVAGGGLRDEDDIVPQTRSELRRHQERERARRNRQLAKCQAESMPAIETLRAEDAQG